MFTLFYMLGIIIIIIAVGYAITVKSSLIALGGGIIGLACILIGLIFSQGNTEKEQISQVSDENPDSKDSLPSLQIDRNPRIGAARRMCVRMTDSLTKHTGQPAEVLNVRDTSVAIEIDLIIGKELLKSRQELVIIPYARLNDLTYWQQVTRIMVNNYRVDSSEQPAPRRRPPSSQQSTRRRPSSRR